LPGISDRRFPPTDTLPPGLAGNHPIIEDQRREWAGEGMLGVVLPRPQPALGTGEGRGPLRLMGRQIVEPARDATSGSSAEMRAVARLRHRTFVAAVSAPRLGEAIVLRDGIMSRRARPGEAGQGQGGPLPGRAQRPGLFAHQWRWGSSTPTTGRVWSTATSSPQSDALRKGGPKATVKVLRLRPGQGTREEKVSRAHLTSEGEAPWATPDFTAPEQISTARPAGHSGAESTASGGTLYSSLTPGRPPFQATSPLRTLPGPTSSRDASRLNFRSGPRFVGRWRPSSAKDDGQGPGRRFPKDPREVAEALSVLQSPGSAAQRGNSLQARPGRHRAAPHREEARETDGRIRTFRRARRPAGKARQLSPLRLPAKPDDRPNGRRPSRTRGPKAPRVVRSGQAPLGPGPRWSASAAALPVLCRVDGTGVLRVKDQGRK